jgi:selenocysteine-specific elongation factor
MPMATHKQLLDRIRAHLASRGELRVADVRELGEGLTRKYAIPLLEYLDGAGLTIRDGDVRRPGPAL